MSNFSQARFLPMALVLLNLFHSTSGFSGWGVGSAFAPYNKEGFDFAMSYPKDWVYEEDQPKSGDCSSWGCYLQTVFSNKSLISVNSSTVQMKFFNGAKVAGIDDLLSAAKLRHPEVPENAWKKDTKEWPFQKVTSGEYAGTKPTERVAHEYYLIGAGRVIELESHGFPEGQGLFWVEQIRSSINRSTEGPTVLEVSWDKDRYRPGEEACLSIIVEDLPGSVAKDSLTSILFQGDIGAVFEMRIGFAVFDESHTATPKLAKGVCDNEGAGENLPSKNGSISEISRFQVRIRVPKYFDRSDLNIKAIDLDNNNGGGTICSTSDQKLSCKNSTGGKQYFPRMAAVEVNNPKPDVIGPEIESLRILDNGFFHLHTRDQSGPYYAILELDSSSKIVIFPDQLGANSQIDLSKVGKWGRNVINRIVILDQNRIPTILTSNEFGNYDCRKYQIRKDADRNYVKMSSLCEKQFPVVSFLGGQK